MSGYKLFYFPGRVGGEKCRLAFAAAKIDYEDNRLADEEWAKEKACLCPANRFDEATADMITDQVGDLTQPLINIYNEKDETKKEEIRKEFYGTTLPVRLEKFEALLKNRDEGKGFFLGEKLSYADILFFDFFNSFHAKGKEDVPGELEKFPLLVEHYKRVLNVPEINEWVKKRPVTEF
ncbi:glutathione S-transferase 1-like [Porites lutea]|uniref:glutathione S-transferase 1-like n=1 Tax=Porites lutea TaxID=51062 RepID=UPI003CC5F438